MDDDTYVKHKPGSFKKRSRDQYDNGKLKSRDPHPGQDKRVATTKVIETLFRILCPVKKIGSVLGKGGGIINAIRDETHAKIRVTDAIPGAEERVIIIFNYTSNQSVESATEKDHENEPKDMWPHGPAQDALLKVHDRVAADEYIRGGVVHEKTDPDDAVTARLLVPSNQVGCLIGKGGTVIQKLRSDYTGASIRVLPADSLPPCARKTDELVQISGAPAVVKKALYDVSTRLHQHPRKENPPVDDLIYTSTEGLFQHGASMPPPHHGNPVWPHCLPDIYAEPAPPPRFVGYRNEPSGYGLSSYNRRNSANDDETSEEFSMRILCPTGKIGGVIGKAGANVRELENQTHAKIKVEDANHASEERIINVSSREVPWDPMSPTIDAVLQLQSRTCATSEDGTVTTKLLVPSSKAGCLLGQGGSIITEMRRRTRADIKVHSKEDEPSYTSTNEELVQISGSSEVVKVALLEIASRLRARTFRSGNDAKSSALVFLNRTFSPPERMTIGGFTPTGMIGAAGNPPPVYPVRGIARPENSSRGQSSSGMSGGLPSSSMIRETPAASINRACDTGGYEYSRRSYEYPQDSYEYPIGNFTYPKGSYDYPKGGYEYQKGSEPAYERQGYAYEAQGYPPGPPPAATGYPNMSISVEIKIPNSAVASVLGVGGSNISDIHMISGARVKLRDILPGSSECTVEIHGSSEQIKSAQCLLQAFVASGGQGERMQMLLATPIQASSRRPY